MNMDMISEGSGPERLDNERSHSLPSRSKESGSPDISFQDLLKGLVQQVDSLQKEADASIQGLATGETTDIHDVTMKMEEAGIAFDLMMQVRNKLVEAYQQIIKMQQ